MKNRIVLLLVVVVLASCSAPKYTYYFDHQNNHANGIAHPEGSLSVPTIDPQMLSAATESEPVKFPAAKSEVPEKKTYLQMNKMERKALRHHLNKDVKTYIASKKNWSSIESSKATQGMDNDLKLASIFGAVGIVALIIAGDVFYIIGGIALLIGVVFFVKWIIRQ